MACFTGLGVGSQVAPQGPSDQFPALPEQQIQRSAPCPSTAPLGIVSCLDKLHRTESLAGRLTPSSAISLRGLYATFVCTIQPNSLKGLCLYMSYRADNLNASELVGDTSKSELDSEMLSQRQAGLLNEHEVIPLREPVSGTQSTGREQTSSRFILAES